MHNNGPLLVFAGAGSGKTRVITYRIARLIKDHICEPENILAITFTRKAAGEMKDRVKSILAKLAEQSKDFAYPRSPLISTFHAFGAYILRKDGHYIGIDRNFSIFDPNDTEVLIKQIMDELNIDKKQFNPANIRYSISSSKNEMIDPKQFKQFVQSSFDEVVASVYPKYEEQLREQGAVDFDDLQILPLVLFKENPTVLERYNNQFKYILVDEYQDTNEVQYRLVKYLAGKNNNLCVVGDDDQGIYRWRGATIKNILSFEKDFKGTVVVKLEKNYRSTQNILDSAYAIVHKNNERVEKKLWTDSEKGSPIHVYEAKRDFDEAKFVIDKILDLSDINNNENSVRLKDIAILYRTNAQSRIFEEELLKNAIPYRLVGGLRFYERREIKDLLAYLRFLANPRDEVSFQRIINTPPRKIGIKSILSMNHFVKKTFNGRINLGLFLIIAWKVTDKSSDWKKEFSTYDIDDFIINLIKTDDQCKAFIERYAELVSLFGKLWDFSMKNNVRLLLDEVLSQVKYIDWIDDGSDDAVARKENIFELKVIADRYSDYKSRDSLLSFLADIALVEQDQISDKDVDENDMVTLMTLHSAKGLEFDTVFIVGMEEGLFPHSLSFASVSDLEEERRLCYVGITRAKKRLYLTFAGNRKTYTGLTDRIPSRFISELPEELVKFDSWNSGESYYSPGDNFYQY
ncbi:UvrD-helicase domain-containing protein [Candidatus Dojkabacteria bacterium]|nr:UvrD-helicase domain-containing protein [Candidatus Dojkabacteria bacterium]